MPVEITGTDLNGYNPFPAPTRYPGQYPNVGPLSQWTQSDSHWLSPYWDMTNVPTSTSGPKMVK